MRLLAIGDIHGCLIALDTLLEAVRPQPDDQIVTLGDYVDRGPDSRGVLDRLLQLRQQFPLVALRGNHEQMMVQARTDPEVREDWLLFGGQATLLSYGQAGEPGRLEEVPQHHWLFLEKNLVWWHETDSHFFVHANVRPDLPLAEQPETTLLWEKLIVVRPHVSGKIMVCGHTAQKNGLPLFLEHAICLDTYVYGDGWLTCLDVGSGQVWQANQRGESRQWRLVDS